MTDDEEKVLEGAAPPEADAVSPAAEAETAEQAKPAEERAEEPAATQSPESKALSGGLTLLFLRHADAGDPAAWTGDDSDRPLSKKGRRQSKHLGSHLDSLDVDVDAILTSPKLRAADTAKIVGKALGVRARVDDRLEGGFDSGGLASLVEGLEAAVSSVLLVGHDPDFSDVVSWLVGAPIALRKAALARVDLEDRRVAAGEAALRWLLPPDAVAG